MCLHYLLGIFSISHHGLLVKTFWKSSSNPPCTIQKIVIDCSKHFLCIFILFPWDITLVLPWIDSNIMQTLFWIHLNPSCEFLADWPSIYPRIPYKRNSRNIVWHHHSKLQIFWSESTWKTFKMPTGYFSWRYLEHMLKIILKIPEKY